jgi:lysine 2,3-aminomutase
MRGRVSGLCQPDYVLDIPGGAGKCPVGPNYLLPTQNTAGVNGEGETEMRYRVRDYCGEVHLYPPE